MTKPTLEHALAAPREPQDRRDTFWALTYVPPGEPEKVQQDAAKPAREDGPTKKGGAA